ncbi:hypothetical protein BD779DRAFT_1479878 [Infundibulicybe gibba]|nr:hypothetical protein BD779DRAFT_1479878 [Infundibulicybe gibba]
MCVRDNIDAETNLDGVNALQRSPFPDAYSSPVKTGPAERCTNPGKTAGSGVTRRNRRKVQFQSRFESTRSESIHAFRPTMTCNANTLSDPFNRIGNYNKSKYLLPQYSRNASMTQNLPRATCSFELALLQPHFIAMRESGAIWESWPLGCQQRLLEPHDVGVRRGGSGQLLLLRRSACPNAYQMCLVVATFLPSDHPSGEKVLGNANADAGIGRISPRHPQQRNLKLGAIHGATPATRSQVPASAATRQQARWRFSDSFSSKATTVGGCSFRFTYLAW